MIIYYIINSVVTKIILLLKGGKLWYFMKNTFVIINYTNKNGLFYKMYLTIKNIRLNLNIPTNNHLG